MHAFRILFTLCLVPVCLLAACTPPVQSQRGDEAPRRDGAGSPLHLEISALYGRGGVAADHLAPGTMLGVGAKIEQASTISTPSGLRAQLKAEQTHISLEENSRIALGERADGPHELLEGEVVLQTTSAAPLELRIGADRLTLVEGEVLLRRRGDKPYYAQVRGHSELVRNEKRTVLLPGQDVDTPPDVAPTPSLSLRPLDETRWLESLRSTTPKEHTLVSAPAPGIGRLRGRRAGSKQQRQQVRLKEQQVRVHVTGNVAHTEIEQVFFNDSRQELEGLYEFPLPADAALSGLSLLVGDRWREAAMIEKQRARRIFREIVDATVPRDPALLQWDRGNLFRLNIFPIPAHGERRIRISYTQVLGANSELTRYRFPLGGGDNSATEIEHFRFLATVDTRDFNADQLSQLRAPLEDMEMSSGRNATTFTFERSRYLPTHELGIDIPRPRQNPLHRYRDKEGEEYVSFTLRPELRFNGAPRSVDYTFVFDRSHSTSSRLKDLSRELLLTTVRNLAPDDRFRLLACDTACSSLSPSFDAGGSASAIRVDEFIAKQRLGGASDLGLMLDSAADALREGRDDTEHVLVYLGDGVASSGRLAPDELTQLADARLMDVRIEAVALGAKSDTLILGELTRRSGGDLLRAGLGDDPAELVRELTLRARVPVARDLALEVPPVLEAVYPKTLPALRPGEGVTVFAKLRRGAPEDALTISLRGMGPEAPFEREIRLELNESQAGHGGASIAKAWAQAHIEWLTTNRGHAARSEIIRSSKQHRVLSRYTALIALENTAMYQEFGLSEPESEEKSEQLTQWGGRVKDEVAPREAPLMPEAPTRPPAKSASLDDDAEAFHPNADFGPGSQGRSSKKRKSRPSRRPGAFSRPRPRTQPQSQSQSQWKTTITRNKAITPHSSAKVRRLQRVRDEQPTLRSRHRDLVRTALRTGHDKAPDFAQAWVDADPDYAPAMLALGDALASVGDESAPRIAAGALESQPFSKTLHRRLARAFAYQEDWQRACSHRRAVVSIDPSLAQNHIDLARCLHRAGQPESAQETLRAAHARVAHDRERLIRAETALARGRSTLHAHPALKVTLHWEGDSTPRLGLVDRRGRRLSGLRPQGVRIRRSVGEEVLTVAKLEGTSFIEVGVPEDATSRHPIRATLIVKTPERRRRFQLELEAGHNRLVELRRFPRPPLY